MYLTGATLFLSLILSRVFYILLDFIRVQEDFNALQGKTAKGSATTGQTEELRKRVRELEAELKTEKTSARDFGEYPRAGALAPARAARYLVAWVPSARDAPLLHPKLTPQTPSRSRPASRRTSTTASQTSTSRP